MFKLTKRIVDGLEVRNLDYLIWDRDVKVRRSVLVKQGASLSAQRNFAKGAANTSRPPHSGSASRSLTWAN